MKNYDDDARRTGGRDQSRQEANKRPDRDGRHGTIDAKDDDDDAGRAQFGAEGGNVNPYPQTRRGDDWARDNANNDPARYAGNRGRSGYREYPRANEDMRAYGEDGGREQRRLSGDGARAGQWGSFGGNDGEEGARERVTSQQRGYRVQGAETYGGAPDTMRHAGARDPNQDEDDLDPDYRGWRSEQMKALDDDYKAYRKDKQSKFSEEFEKFRKSRDRTGTASQSAGTKFDNPAKAGN